MVSLVEFSDPLQQEKLLNIHTGKVALIADRYILSMLRFGRNRRILLSTPRNAFNPSNN